MKPTNYYNVVSVTVKERGQPPLTFKRARSVFKSNNTLTLCDDSRRFMRKFNPRTTVITKIVMAPKA